MTEFVFTVIGSPWLFVVLAVLCLMVSSSSLPGDTAADLYLVMTGVFLGFAAVVWHLSRIAGAQ